MKTLLVFLSLFCGETISLFSQELHNSSESKPKIKIIREYTYSEIDEDSGKVDFGGDVEIEELIYNIEGNVINLSKYADLDDYEDKDPIATGVMTYKKGEIIKRVISVNILFISINRIFTRISKEGDTEKWEQTKKNGSVVDTMTVVKKDKYTMSNEFGNLSESWYNDKDEIIEEKSADCHGEFDYWKKYTYCESGVEKEMVLDESGSVTKILEYSYVKFDNAEKWIECKVSENGVINMLLIREIEYF